MLSMFYPDEWEESPLDLDYASYYQDGYRGIIFDIDNTLVPHGFPATEEMVRFFEKLHGVPMKTCLLSNNKEPRVKPFADAVSCEYIYLGGKPSRRGYEAAMEKMGTDPASTLFIGDQLFTDVFGAKRCGLHTILVKPIDPREEIQIVLKRLLERPILAAYRRSRKKELTEKNISGDLFRKDKNRE